MITVAICWCGGGQEKWFARNGIEQSGEGQGQSAEQHEEEGGRRRGQTVGQILQYGLESRHAQGKIPHGHDRPGIKDGHTATETGQTVERTPAFPRGKVQTQWDPTHQTARTREEEALVEGQTKAFEIPIVPEGLQ